MPGFNKRMNVYADILPLYDFIPKAVLAAIACSALTGGGARLEEAPKLIMREWWDLHLGGVVPQRPPGPMPLDLLAEAAE